MSARSALFRRIITASSAVVLIAVSAAAALAAAGQLDKSFGVDGQVLTSVTAFGHSELFEDVAVQADSRILGVAGVVRESESSGFDVGVVRYMPNGSLDPNFGNGGVVVTDLTGTNGNDSPAAIAVQADGKILVAGTAVTFGRNSDSYFFALTRYLPDGRLDGTFGRNGSVLTGFSSGNRTFGTDVALEPDGRIVVLGTVNTCDADFICTGTFALARYTPDGKLDKGFGQRGTLTTDFGLGGETRGVALGIQADGRIVAAGSTAGFFALARYALNGALDGSFGTGGLVTTAFTPGRAFASAMALQSDGKIVVTGSRTDDNDNLTSAAIARYGPDGTLDPAFGSLGTVTVEIRNGRLSTQDVVIQLDEKIVIGGTFLEDPTFHGGGGDAFALVRFDTNGSLDRTFGGGGTATTNFGDTAELRALALQPDGRIVAGGCFDCASDIGSDLALARYLTA